MTLFTTPSAPTRGFRLVRGSLIAAALLGGLAMACDDASDDGDGAPVPTVSSQATPGAGGSGTAEAGGPSLTDPALTVRTIEGLDSPTQMAFLGPDDLLVTEKATGKVVRVQNGTVTGDVVQLKANFADERGVLGIAMHPDFTQNNYVYIYWTWTGEGEEPDGLFGEPSDDIEAVPDLGNRVDRFTWDGERLSFDQNIIALPSRITDLTMDRRRGNHNAGVIKFGPDGKLYIVNGDQNDRGPLQNVADGELRGADAENGTLAGVVLRLNDDGTTPTDNPFAGQAERPEWEKIWVYGVRNSFGFDWDPRSGNFWLQANGQASYDQIGMYEGGDNVGWVQLMGPPERFDEYKALEIDTERLLDSPEFPPDRLAASAEEAQSRLVLLPGATYRAPLFSWKYAVAPTALEFIEGDALGADYAGAFLVGDVNTGTLYLFRVAEDGASLVLEDGLADGVNDNTDDDPIGELADSVFGEGFLVATDIKSGPDGSIWISSIAGGAIYQITRR